MSSIPSDVTIRWLPRSSTVLTCRAFCPTLPSISYTTTLVAPFVASPLCRINDSLSPPLTSTWRVLLNSRGIVKSQRLSFHLIPLTRWVVVDSHHFFVWLPLPSSYDCPSLLVSSPAPNEPFCAVVAPTLVSQLPSPDTCFPPQIL